MALVNLTAKTVEAVDNIVEETINLPVALGWKKNGWLKN